MGLNIQIEVQAFWVHHCHKSTGKHTAPLHTYIGYLQSKVSCIFQLSFLPHLQVDMAESRLHCSQNIHH